MGGLQSEPDDPPQVPGVPLAPLWVNRALPEADPNYLYLFFANFWKQIAYPITKPIIKTNQYKKYKKEYIFHPAHCIGNATDPIRTTSMPTITRIVSIHPRHLGLVIFHNLSSRCLF